MLYLEAGVDTVLTVCFIVAVLLFADDEWELSLYE